MHTINWGRSYTDFFWLIWGLKEGPEWVHGLAGGQFYKDDRLLYGIDNSLFTRWADTLNNYKIEVA